MGAGVSCSLVARTGSGINQSRGGRKQGHEGRRGNGERAWKRGERERGRMNGRGKGERACGKEGGAEERERS